MRLIYILMLLVLGTTMSIASPAKSTGEENHILLKAAELSASSVTVVSVPGVEWSRCSAYTLQEMKVATYQITFTKTKKDVTEFKALTDPETPSCSLASDSDCGVWFWASPTRYCRDCTFRVGTVWVHCQQCIAPES